ncbi:MAG: tRNA lysidine(34) synthetase TilS [Solirubrobacterales bacterium]
MSPPLRPESIENLVRESGLVSAADSVVVLVSGGADSACAAAGLRGLLGTERVRGLHLDYGLRDDSAEDAAVCERLCAALGIELTVERPALEPGNVQAAAREARYNAAEALRTGIGFGLIATGHTLTDLAETMLYRLATSPGRRALLGLAPRRGRVVRPLLGASRERVRELVAEAGLPFRDDPSNEQPLYARNRIRNELLPLLRELAPSAEQTIAATWAELAEEADALEALAAEALERAGAGHGAVAVSVAELQALHPALRRLALRRLAEQTAGAAVALGPERCRRILALAASPEGGTVELGGGVEASVEAGHVRFRVAAPAERGEVALAVPGSCRFGQWELRAEVAEDHPAPRGAEAALLDAAKLGGELRVRGWRQGDRMRPLGLGGSKSLQDLFTDAKVPRSLRSELPVVTSEDRIAWVAGVAVSDEFKLEDSTERAALLTAIAE